MAEPLRTPRERREYNSKLTVTLNGTRENPYHKWGF